MIRSRVWFPGIDRKVEEMVKLCIECQANSDRQSFEPLKPSPMPPTPWHTLSGDFFGPMEDGTYWFVNYDEYSKWASVDQIKNVSEEQVEPVLEKLFSIFGSPIVYKTDNGSPFQSYKFAEFAKQWGFKHRKITPLWPRANGGAESFMKKLGKVIKNAKISKINKNELLQAFLRRYRETPHSTTKVPPALLLMGYSRSSGIPQIESPLTHKRLVDWHEFARKNQLKANEQMQKEFDERMRVKECNIRLGSLVLVKLKKISKSTPSWDPNPYQVTAVNGSMITAMRHGYSTTRNSSFFKLFRFDDTDSENESSSTSSANKKVCEEGGSLADSVDSNNQELIIIGSEQITYNREQNQSETNQNISNQEQDQIETDQNNSNQDQNKIVLEQNNSGETEPEQTKIGRPSKEQSILNKEARRVAQAQKIATNPPTRTSARIAKQVSFEGGGKM